MTRYATIFGFGLFNPAKKDYKAYLDRAAKFINRRKIDEVVLCGGHTDVKHPKESEAGTMAAYLRTKVGKNVKLHIQSKSITSEQNVSFAKKHLDLGARNKVFVICDSARFFKLYWFILDRWFGLSKHQIIDNWFDIAEQVYSDPKKKGTAMELRDLRHRLKYRNVELVIDRLHKDYNSSMHNSITEIFEIEGLHDKRVYRQHMAMTRRKFKMR